MHEKNKAEAEKLEQFVNEALAFNKKHNIFVRKSTKEVYEKDVHDCLPVLQKINNSDKILDLGSGGGFPSEGLVFKYKGNIYKFTGAFAPINQILGSLKF